MGQKRRPGGGFGALASLHRRRDGHRWTALSPQPAPRATLDRTSSRTSCQAGYAEGGAKWAN